MVSVNRIDIVYYSGTGGTKQVAEYFEEVCLREGCDVRMFRLFRNKEAASSLCPASEGGIGGSGYHEPGSIEIRKATKGFLWSGVRKYLLKEN